MKVLLDICESSELKLSESTQRRGVLGTVEGVFFVADRPSRNGRLYPRQLWENVLRSDDVKRLLENRLMIGTVGHDEVDFDSLIRDQKASHVVTELRILPDGKGYGKAEILDTPVGRILHTLLKSGSRMSVSSKGYGEYLGTTPDGIQEVDPNSYILERFDFVVDPGFLEARPALREQYEKAIKNQKEDSEIVRKLVRIKQDLEEKLAAARKDKKDESFDSELEKLCDKLVEDFGIDPDDLKGKTYSEILEKVNASLDFIRSKLSSSSEREVRSMTRTAEEIKQRLKERLRQRLQETKESTSEGGEKKTRTELLEKIRRRARVRRLLLEARRRRLLRRESPLRERRLLLKRRFGESGLASRRSELLRRLLERRRRARARAATRSRLGASMVRGALRRPLRRAAESSPDLERMRTLLRKALPVIKEVNRLGGIQSIRKSLKESKRTLTDLGKRLLDEYANKLSAMTGVPKDTAKKLIKKYGMEEARAQLLARRSVNEAKVPRKVATDSEVLGSGEDRPLSEVILKRIDEQVKVRPAALPQDIYKA